MTPTTSGGQTETTSSDLRARETHRQVVTRLKSSAGRSSRGAAGYTRWINRWIGRHIAAFGYLHGMTPNQMTVLSGVLTLPTLLAIALVRPSWPTSILITAVLLVGYTFDSADGQLARLRGSGSLAGEYFDHCVDAVKTSTVHLMILIAWYRFYDLSHPALLLIPLIFAVVHPVFFFSLMLSDSLKARTSAAGAPAVPSAEPAPILPSIVVLPNDWGVMCICLALLPAVGLFIGAYTALLAANTLFLVVGLIRWYRRLLTA